MAVRLTWLCVFLTGCATSEIYPPLDSVYWDQPTTERYWVPEGVQVASILEGARQCGAKVDGGIANHGIVPPGFSVNVFYFVGENSVDSRECTVKKLRAIPKLTAYVR